MICISNYVTCIKNNVNFISYQYSSIGRIEVIVIHVLLFIIYQNFAIQFGVFFTQWYVPPQLPSLSISIYYDKTFFELINSNQTDQNITTWYDVITCTKQRQFYCFSCKSLSLSQIVIVRMVLRISSRDTAQLHHSSFSLNYCCW